MSKEHKTLRATHLHICKVIEDREIDSVRADGHDDDGNGRNYPRNPREAGPAIPEHNVSVQHIEKAGLLLT